MALKHLNWRSKDGYTVPEVPEDWLGITAQANAFVQKISQVTGLHTKVGPGLAESAGTAQFLPALSLIEVDSDKLMPGVDPEKVLWSDPLFTARHPLLHGALSHESAHARYTRFVPADLAKFEGMTRPMIDVLVLLEESRIERCMLIDTPGTREWLPSLVWDFLARDVEIGDTPYAAAGLAALILARADAGSITWTEAQPFRDLILTRLSEDTLNTLRGLWTEYHALPFPDDGETTHAEEQISIATRWLEALGIDPQAEPQEMIAMPMPGEGEGEGDESEGGESQGSGSGDSGGEPKGLGEKAVEAAQEAAHGEKIKATEKVGKVKFDQRAQERDAERTRHAVGEKAARKAFPGGVGPTDSSVSSVTHRPPTTEERAAAVKFARHLAKVIWTDRQVSRFNTERPGGRLRGRGAVMRSAQKSAGMRPTAAHWTQKKRQVVDEPKIRLGLMTDISGSMSGAVQPMGSTAYIVGQGVNAVDGIFASVTYAERVYGVVRPGGHVRDVPVMAANGGWENFREAFAALDSTLDLLDGDGVRILVIASDGCYGAEGQREAANLAMRLCLKKGVIPVHLDFTGRIYQYDNTYGSRLGLTREPVDVRGKKPAEVAQIVGAAVVREVAYWKARQGVAA